MEQFSRKNTLTHTHSHSMPGDFIFLEKELRNTERIKEEEEKKENKFLLLVVKERRNVNAKQADAAFLHHHFVVLLLVRLVLKEKTLGVRPSLPRARISFPMTTRETRNGLVKTGGKTTKEMRMSPSIDSFMDFFVCFFFIFLSFIWVTVNVKTTTFGLSRRNILRNWYFLIVIGRMDAWQTCRRTFILSTFLSAFITRSLVHTHTRDINTLKKQKVRNCQQQARKQGDRQADKLVAWENFPVRMRTLLVFNKKRKQADFTEKTTRHGLA